MAIARDLGHVTDEDVATAYKMVGLLVYLRPVYDQHDKLVFTLESLN